MINCSPVSMRISARTDGLRPDLFPVSTSGVHDEAMVATSSSWRTTSRAYRS